LEVPQSNLQKIEELKLTDDAEECQEANVEAIAECIADNMDFLDR